MPAFHFLSQSPVVDGWQKVAYVGDFVHPVTGKKFSLSQEHFKGWKDYFEYLLENKESLPVVPNHSFDPTDRLGTVTDVKYDENSFYVKKEFTDPEMEKKVAKASFSVYIRDEQLEANGRVFPHAILHLGVTDYPVLKGLKDIAASCVFLESDIKNEGVDLKYISKVHKEPEPELEDDMPFSKELVASLGLSEDATEAQVLSAISSMQGTVAQAEKDKELAISRVVAERVAKVDALAIADEQKTKLKQFCTSEQVRADLSLSGESLFDISLSTIPSGDENFQTGPQTDAEDKEVSLSFAMDELSKADDGIQF